MGRVDLLKSIDEILELHPERFKDPKYWMIIRCKTIDDLLRLAKVDP